MGIKSDYTEKAHPILELYSLLSEKSEHFLFAKNQAGEEKNEILRGNSDNKKYQHLS